MRGMADPNVETVRLYWEDPLLEVFQATVLSAEKNPEGGARVVLDRTAFYPEGGGQPSDEGMLGPAEVQFVSESDDGIVHHVDRVLKPGTKAEGRLDWTLRWDHMQQHTGQHLLSRVLDAEFDASTQGFHLGSDEVTIDLSKDLDEKQLAFAQNRANALIDADLPVTARFVGRDDPAAAAARRLPEDIETVRIIEIEGLDTVPCGGTHVPSTSRIGGIHILPGSGVRKHGDLFRISFVCGGRLRARLGDLDRIATELSRTLTTAPEQFAERFEDAEEQKKDLQREVEDLRSALIPLRAARLLEGAETEGDHRVVMARIDDLPAETLPALAAELTRHPDVVALLGAEVAGTGRLIFARGEAEGPDMQELLIASAALLEGRGGGDPRFARGGGSRGEALDMALSTARDRIRGTAGA